MLAGILKCSWALLLPLLMVMLVLTQGCKSDPGPSADERQDAALRDPFKYSPYSDDPDVSGGDMDEYDRKAMKKDVDNVLNP